MYNDAKSRIRANGSYSDEFEVKVGLHQGSVLSPLLFIIVSEALPKEFCTGCSWELLNADDLVLIAETLEKLVEEFEMWKRNLESKKLRLNMGNTKIILCGKRLDMIRTSGKYPGGVCGKGVEFKMLKF